MWEVIQRGGGWAPSPGNFFCFCLEMMYGIPDIDALFKKFPCTRQSVIISWVLPNKITGARVLRQCPHAPRSLSVVYPYAASDSPSGSSSLAPIAIINFPTASSWLSSGRRVPSMSRCVVHQSFRSWSMSRRFRPYSDVLPRSPRNCATWWLNSE